MDIDHFKVINDTHGHINGDHVLAALGATLNEAFPDDTVVRFGGEEFCILVCNLTEEAVLQKTELLRQEIERLDPVGVKVSISSGIVGSKQHPGLTLSEYISYADQALYKAKELGRNRVCINKNGGLHLSPYQSNSPVSQNIKS
jgi:two-component system cell cycle response regulator